MSFLFLLPHSFLLSCNLEFLPSVFFFVFLLLSTPLFLHSFFASFFHNFFFVHPPMTNLPFFSPSFLCSTFQPSPSPFVFVFFSHLSQFSIFQRNASVHHMLNVNGMKTTSRNINASVLRRVQKNRIKFVVVMAELTLTDEFWKETLV